MPSTFQLSLAILSNTVHLLLLTVMVYCCFRIHKFRRCQMVQKRYPFLLYLGSILFGVYLLQHVFYKFAYIYDATFNFDFEQTPSAPAVLDLVSMIMYYLSLHGMAIVLLVRAWFIYFNTKCGIQIQRMKWSVLLNTESEYGSESAWFVRHRKDFGSHRFVYTAAIAYYLLEVLLLLAARAANFFAVTYIDIFLWFVELIVLTVIWNRIPEFYDVFGIKRETQLILRIAFFALLISIALTVMMAVGINPLWLWMLFQFCLGAAAGAAGIIVNSYVFWRYKEQLRQQIAEKDVAEMSVLSISSMNSMSIVHANSMSDPEIPAESTRRLSLKDVLGNQDYIDLLFNHLNNEFSVELLLSLVEFKQFHDAMANDAEFMARAHDSVQGAKPSALDRFDLPPEMPHSSTVSAKHDGAANQIERYLLIANDLCVKYVNYGSESEINISYACREEILAFMTRCKLLQLDEHTFGDLFVLFDAASSQMYQLLKYSHNRCAHLGNYQPS